MIFIAHAKLPPTREEHMDDSWSKETLVVLHMLFWTSIANRIQLEHRLDFLFCRRSNWARATRERDEVYEETSVFINKGITKSRHKVTVARLDSIGVQLDRLVTYRLAKPVTGICRRCRVIVATVRRRPAIDPLTARSWILSGSWIQLPNLIGRFGYEY